MEKAYKVLLVDDEMNVLNALARSLRKEPYEVIIAASAMEGLNKLYATRIDLIISDYKMPVTQPVFDVFVVMPG